ncbi:receptor-like protein kinase [Artemisia annua]|uniref:Receptor-like protein kinase n=1 Tax=Artemisia annua TaxID=35608 RepID=A0A2U1MW76_ARTAN|nr:receptor-like protein kinase [Artemisia annua]
MDLLGLGTTEQYCVDTPKWFLVFENLENGSLKEHLNDPLKTPLDWRIRLKIVVGVNVKSLFLEYRDFGVEYFLMNIDPFTACRPPENVLDFDAVLTRCRTVLQFGTSVVQQLDFPGCDVGLQLLDDDVFEALDNVPAPNGSLDDVDEITDTRLAGYMVGRHAISHPQNSDEDKQNLENEYVAFTDLEVPAAYVCWHVLDIEVPAGTPDWTPVDENSPYELDPQGTPDWTPVDENSPYELDPQGSGVVFDATEGGVFEVNLETKTVNEQYLEIAEQTEANKQDQTAEQTVANKQGRQLRRSTNENWKQPPTTHTGRQT